MNDLYSMISMASNKLRTNKNIISFYKINVRLIIYKKKNPPLCFHTLFRFVSPYECNAISSSFFFLLTLIQFNGSEIQTSISYTNQTNHNHFCVHVRITFPQKNLILIMHPAHFLVCPLQYLHISCMPH